MTNRTAEGKTHNSDTFLDFAYDMLDYTLSKYGIPFMKPSDYSRTTKKLFIEDFGNAVMLFRDRHSQDVPEMSTLISEMESTEDILLYVARLQQKIFKGDIPLMEFIAYCAFLLDMSLICISLEDVDLLYNIVDDSVSVFRQYIKPYFTVVGGWYSLYRVAKQYELFVTFKPQSNLAASTESTDSDLYDVWHKF